MVFTVEIQFILAATSAQTAQAASAQTTQGSIASTAAGKQFVGGFSKLITNKF